MKNEILYSCAAGSDYTCRTSRTAGIGTSSAVRMPKPTTATKVVVYRELGTGWGIPNRLSCRRCSN